MPERMLTLSTSHFVTRTISAYRTRADERSWRKAAYRSRSNRTWEWLIRVIFVIGIAYTGYHLVQTQQHLGTMQSELETVKRDAERAKAQATEFASLFASLNSEAAGNLKTRDGGQQSFRPSDLSPSICVESPSTLSTSVVPPAAYVVRDAAGNCAVVDFQPSAGSDLKIIERSDYAECKDVVDRKDLISEVEQGVEAKFEAARVKAGSQ